MKQERREGRNRNERVWKVAKLSIVTLMVVLSFTLFGDVTKTYAQNMHMNYSWISMTEGYSIDLKVKGTKKKITWKSSNKKVATVSGAGKVKGKKAGKCTVTAKAGKKKIKCTVTVKKIKVNKVEIKEFTETALNVSGMKLDVHDVTYDSKGKAVIDGNKNGTYKLELLNNKKDITWSSSNNAVAAVKSGLVTAKAKGSCTITAKADGKSYTCSVTVTDLRNAEAVYNQKNIYGMLGMINKDRVKVKAAPLEMKSEIIKVSDIRAKELVSLFSHTRPNGSSYSTTYKEAGVKMGSAIAENVAYTMDSVLKRENLLSVAYSSLYASSGHRKNMLNPNYKYIGISTFSKIYKDQYNNYCVDTYWAQEFYTK